MGIIGKKGAHSAGKPENRPRGYGGTGGMGTPRKPKSAGVNGKVVAAVAAVAAAAVVLQGPWALSR